jgi:cytochrome P450
MEASAAPEAGAVPPGPRGDLLFGVYRRARRDPLAFFLESARQYGDVVSMRFGPRRVWLLSHPDDVRHVLLDNAHAYGKQAPAARIRPLFGDSLTTVDGEPWRRQRRLLRPALQPRGLGAWIPVIVEATGEMLARWQRLAARGDVLDVLSEMRRLTRSIVLRGLFGAVDTESTPAVGQALDVALEHADQRLWGALGWLGAPTTAHRRSRAAIRTIDRFVADMIAQADRGWLAPDCLLPALLDARDPATGQRMSERELHAEVKALLVAGHTTTTSALGWVWNVLAEQPEVAQRLRRELQTVLGGRVPGADDLPALVYARRVIDEVLRLYPPTWLTARTPLQDDRIRGYRIPPRTIVMLSPFVTHRRPELWPEPERFDPERFTPERAEGRPRFAYFPFGGGPRSCLGSWLASAMLQLVVATVAARFQMTRVPGSRVDMRPGLTLQPSPGVPMTLRACESPAPPDSVAQLSR